MDCVALGDDIAVNVAQVLNCRNLGGFARSAFEQVAVTKRVRSKLVVISLGTYGPCAVCRDPNLLFDLAHLRTAIAPGSSVVWIAPYDVEAAKVVRSVARSNKDRVVELKNFETFDGIRPHNYRAVAMGVMGK